MKTIECYTPQDSGYEDVCRFAHGIYARNLSFNLTHFPEVLFAATEGEVISGCMGLNTNLRFPLFVHNPLLKSITTCIDPKVVCGEQSILALQHYGIGLPVLISVTAEYGRCIGIQKLAYAAIPVSQKTIQSLEFETTECGPADLKMFPEKERHLYKPWHSLNPVCYLLDTKNATTICRRVLKRFSNKVSLGQRLADIFSVYPKVEYA